VVKERGRVKLLLDREWGGLPYRAYRLALRRLVKQVEPYHPVSMNGEVLSNGERQCSDRWASISKVLSEGADTVLDLGCAEGYFVSRAAREYGCFALGIDADVRRLTIAQDLNVINKNEHAGFMYSHITLDFLRKLPTFDVVILLAVLHHIMYEHGVDYAREFMKCIREKTRKALIFEMGQSNETSMYWASLLPDMGKDPHEWIKNYLLSCGFSQAVKVGEADGYQSSSKRAVFVAHP
jgi:O-antigen chain-terminating bifunctional methyltransferase/kinase